MKTPSLLAVLGLLAASHASAYEITGTAVSRDRNLVRTEYVVQAGPSVLDKFKMTRLVKDVPQNQLRGSIFFFFPLGTTFSFYEQRDPNGAFGSSIAEFFALRNFDVYGYSPRFEGIPAGTCEISSPAAPPWAAFWPRPWPTTRPRTTTASSSGRACSTLPTPRCAR